MNNEQCAMEHHLDTVCGPQGNRFSVFLARCEINFFSECQYIIYRLVQNIFPADTNLQMRRYQEYSNKYFYSLNHLNLRL